jgi:hypothetical protein
VELRRRWATERACWEARWAKRAMLRWANMVVVVGGCKWFAGGERSRSMSYVEIRAALVDSRDPPAYVT